MKSKATELSPLAKLFLKVQQTSIQTTFIKKIEIMFFI